MTSTVIDLSLYRPNVGVVLFNARAEVWLGRRVGALAADDENIGQDQWRWQMPQGGVDKGEAPVDAAFRELKEETGVSSARLLLMTPGWLPYVFPDGYKRKNWIGQRQKWAVMMFEGPDDEIDLTADDHQEFDAWRWAELEEAQALIVPFKRAVYAEVAEAIAPLRDYLRAKASASPVAG
ncbi:MAG: RNA pyrophosphohydrolase [Pseudomonadota bacterium]